MSSLRKAAILYLKSEGLLRFYARYSGLCKATQQNSTVTLLPRKTFHCFSDFKPVVQALTDTVLMKEIAKIIFDN